MFFLKKDQRRLLSLVQGNGSFQSRALKVGIIAGDSPCTLKGRPALVVFQPFVNNVITDC